MKNVFYILIFSVLILSFSACNKNNNDNEEWRDANITAYEAVTKNSEYKALRTETGPTGVYYKIIKSGNGTEHPLQTSKVKILYKGTYYNGAIFDLGSSGNDIPLELGLDGNVVINGVTYPSTTMARGLSFAIQNMVVGDKWEIWIPYYLGFGVVGLVESYYYQTIIKGYTTLVYEIELVSITQYPFVN